MEKAAGTSTKSPSSARSSASTSSATAVKTPKKTHDTVGEEENRLKYPDLFKVYNIGEEVWIIFNGRWEKAKVIQVDPAYGPHPEVPDLIAPAYKVHYPGWSNKWDEWAHTDTLMADTVENAAKAADENKAEGQLSGGTKLAKKGKQKTPKSAVKGNSKEKGNSQEKGNGQELVSGPPSVEQLTIDEGPGTPKDKTASTARGRPKASGAKVKPEPTAIPTPKRRKPRGSTGKTEDGALPPPTEALNEDDSVVKKEDAADDKPNSRFATPRVSPSASLKSVTPAADSDTAPPSVDASSDIGIRERSQEEYGLLCDHYDAYDPSKAKEITPATPEEQLLLYRLKALIMPVSEAAESVADVLDLPKSPEDREKAAIEVVHKLSLIRVAQRQKRSDATVLRVTLPQRLRSVMADNYIQTVWNGKILKPAQPEHCIETILQAYHEHCMKHPREDMSVYWNQARLSEVANLKNLDMFNSLLQTILLRHEWPQMEDWRKNWKKDKIREPFQKYGFIHLTRYIQLMSFHYNTEHKRMPGKLGQRLFAIYDDLLNFIDTNYASKLDKDYVANFYEDIDDGHLARIKFHTYENIVGASPPKMIVYPFQILSESFFNDLRKCDSLIERPRLGMKISWKKVPVDSAALPDGAAGPA